MNIIYLLSVWLIYRINLGLCLSNIPKTGCPELLPLINGKIDFISASANEKLQNVAIIICNQGFEQFGPKVKTCQRHGLWDPPDESYCAVDIAQHKEVWQSSIMNGYVANLAIDRHIDDNSISCSNTQKEEDPWWAIDLLIPYTVKHIEILQNKYITPSRHLNIHIGNSTDLQSNEDCVYFEEKFYQEQEVISTTNYSSHVNFTKVIYTCLNHAEGRFVSIHLKSRKEHLSFCEVFIFSSMKARAACDQPHTPRRTRVVLSQDILYPGSIVQYFCDYGYDLIGSNNRICETNLTWSNKAPVCGLNVGISKPVFSSPRKVSLPLINDGNIETCLSLYQMWNINILRDYPVYAVRISLAHKSVPRPSDWIKKLIISVSSDNDSISSIACDADIILVKRLTWDFICPNNLYGQLVILKGINIISLHVCEVNVYTLEFKEFPLDVCKKISPLLFPMDKSCIHIHDQLSSPMDEAIKTCGYSKGKLLKIENIYQQTLIKKMLKRTNASKENFWIGASRNFIKNWIWTDNTSVEFFDWESDSPKEKPGCVILSSSANYKWANIKCTEPNHFICQITFTTDCGRPEVNSDSSLSSNFNQTVGSVITYHCHGNKTLVGNESRTCLSNGEWSNEAPQCSDISHVIKPHALASKASPCGPIPIVKSSSSNITSLNSVHYSCLSGFFMYGEADVKCKDGKWGRSPVCILSMGAVPYSETVPTRPAKPINKPQNDRNRQPSNQQPSNQEANNPQQKENLTNSSLSPLYIVLIVALILVLIIGLLFTVKVAVVRSIAVETITDSPEPSQPTRENYKLTKKITRPC